MKKLLLTTLSIIALLFSGNLMAQITWTTSNGVTWDSNGYAATNPPPATILAGDSVILTGGTWTVPLNGFFTQLDNYGVVVINSGATLNADLINNYGTLILNGSISTFIGITNNGGTISGTGTINSLLGGIIPPITNSNGGSINGCTDPTGCINDSTSSNIGLPPPPAGGSNIDYTSGTLQATTCLDNVSFQADYTIDVASGTFRDIRNISVAQGVTLTINSAVALYLCGDINNDGTIIVNVGGALVQAITSTSNQGTGTYEVLQTGFTSLTQYNIWSSPVVDALTINDNASSEYEVFAGANACDVFTYDGSSQSWKYDLKGNPATYACTGNPSVTIPAADLLSGGDGIMDEARGYFMPGTGTATHTFKGEINNGSLSKTVSSSWNLLGNPYPSALNANSFLTDNANVNAIYFWADDNTAGSGYNQTTGYASCNGSGCVAASSTGSNTTVPSGEIAVAQGFWVDMSASTTVNYSNSQRTTNPDVFFKKENDTKQLIWLNVKTPVMNNTLLAGLHSSATDSYDARYDGKFLDGGAASRLVSVLGNDEFSIQALSPLHLGETKTILLKMVTGVAGSHTFSEYKRENIQNGMFIYLKDNVTNVLHDLTTGDYTVNLDANQTYDNRFELVFAYKGVANDDAQEIEDGLAGGTGTVTGVEDVKATDYTLLNQANTYTLYNSNGVNGDIQVISITGTVVWTKNNVKDNSVQIDLNGVSSGIYFIQVINNGERVYTNKIVNP